MPEPQMVCEECGVRLRSTMALRADPEAEQAFMYMGADDFCHYTCQQHIKEDGC